MNLRRTDAIPDLVRGDIFWSGGDDSFLYLKLVGQSGSLTNLCTGHCFVILTYGVKLLCIMDHFRFDISLIATEHLF